MKCKTGIPVSYRDKISRYLFREISPFVTIFSNTIDKLPKRKIRLSVDMGLHFYKESVFNTLTSNPRDFCGINRRNWCDYIQNNHLFPLHNLITQRNDSLGPTNNHECHFGPWTPSSVLHIDLCLMSLTLHKLMVFFFFPNQIILCEWLAVMYF